MTYKEEAEVMFRTTLNEVEKRIGSTSYAKVEGLILGMIREAEFMGEKVYQQRIENHKKTEEHEKQTMEEIMEAKAKQAAKAKEFQRRGHSVKDIAKEMNISTNTVRVYLREDKYNGRMEQ